jgi:hypothetical protein
MKGRKKSEKGEVAEKSEEMAVIFCWSLCQGPGNTGRNLDIFSRHSTGDFPPHLVQNDCLFTSQVGSDMLAY